MEGIMKTWQVSPHGQASSGYELSGVSGDAFVSKKTCQVCSDCAKRSIGLKKLLFMGTIDV